MAAVLTREIVKIFGEISAVDGISLTVPDKQLEEAVGRIESSLRAGIIEA